MRLPERELKKLALATGSNEKAVIRLLGSIRVHIHSENMTSTRQLDLGLRLQNPELLATLLTAIGKDETLLRLEQALRGYYNASPVICGWVGRGDFDPEHVPPHITKGNLLHACRTAGRLRAKALRS